MSTPATDNLLLTERELELLEKLKYGGTLTEAAKDMGVSPSTTRQDMFRLNRKLEAWRRSLNKVEALRRDHPILLKYLPTKRSRARRLARRRR